MPTIFAIDPGSSESGWLWCQSGPPFSILSCGITKNEDLLIGLRCRTWPHGVLLIEKVESYGMAVGAEVFETVYYSGQFAEAASRHIGPIKRIGRKAIKLHLCGTARATQANIRQALLDKFGGSAAIGKKKTQGPLYSVKSHVWSALALAVTYADTAPGTAGFADAPSWEEQAEALKAGQP